MSANTKPLTDVELENLVTEYERLTEKGYKLNYEYDDDWYLIEDVTDQVMRLKYQLQSQ